MQSIFVGVSLSSEFTYQLVHLCGRACDILLSTHIHTHMSKVTPPTLHQQKEKTTKTAGFYWHLCLVLVPPGDISSAISFVLSDFSALSACCFATHALCIHFEWHKHENQQYFDFIAYASQHSMATVATTNTITATTTRQRRRKAIKI